MSNNVLFLGLAVGGVAIAIAAMVAIAFAPASAQMGMQHQGMSMGPTQSVVHPNSIGRFSAQGGSMVDGVQVTGISVSDSNEISVNLRYLSTGGTPNLTVIVTTNPAGVMERMHGQSMSGGMMHSGMMGGAGMMSGQMAMGGQPMVGMNSTAWQAAQPAYAKQSEVGSTILDAGWESSGTTVQVRLSGNDSSAYDATGIFAMVFPRS